MDLKLYSVLWPNEFRHPVSMKEIMKILGVSDIHGNIMAAQHLRSIEANIFDAVIVAGDIGSENTHEIIKILSSFDCPVFYIYGNWDYELDYNLKLGAQTNHLHLNYADIDGYNLTGFSGHPANWGKNPIAQKLFAEHDEAHEVLLKALSEADITYDDAYSEVGLLRQEALERLENKAKKKGIDRRLSKYRRKRDKIDCIGSSKIEKARNARTQLINSTEYLNYKKKQYAISSEVLKLNRKAMVKLIKENGLDPALTVIVSHERLSYTSDDLPSVSLFLFGHRHIFADTTYKGSRFVNVSALDNQFSVLPKGIKKASFGDIHNVNDGSYVILEFDRTRKITVHSKRFNPDYSGWEKIHDFHYGAPLLA